MSIGSNVIGLLTYHHTSNFGSMLQTYALAKAITDLGFKYEIIDYRNKEVEEREFSGGLLKSKSIRDLKNHIIYDKFKRAKSREMNKFLHDMLTVSDEKYDSETIHTIADKYVCIIVGSDLVWDFSINGNDTTYMLDFADEQVKKVAFASSVGGVWEPGDVETVERLLNRFSAIGVRERAIQNMLNEFLPMHADFVCDPTMLIQQCEWRKMAGIRLVSDNYVLCYMSNDDLSIYRDAVAYGAEHGRKVYLISYDWVPENMEPVRPKSIAEFLSLVLYADAVFTASYHGMLFSLYFEKEFYYYNRGWKERMRSISEYLDIQCCETYHGDTVLLDYNLINMSIAKFRDRSLQLLRHYLSE
ncbi:MAG: polysaccharide pyruvyl transferase family protein [Lachnospiraceae bacterium]|nr:polysaccharide pyruvyl transferase family protein [Lachnospiraceae bacterium]